MRFLGTAVVWAVVGLTACAGNQTLEQLDARAGMTSVRSASPWVFARTDPRYSRSTRDYLYLAPLQINRQGVREYFLWVGVASTIDRGFVAPVIEQPRVLYVMIQGEPMELPLRPIAELIRRTDRGPVYATAVPLQAELVARVTLQQLRIIAGAGLESLAAAADDRSPRTYARWGRASGFADFLTAVDR